MANPNASKETRFKKGQSGGPGRPKGVKNGSTYAKEWAEKHGGLERLTDIAMGRIKEFPPGVQAQVAMYLVDRAYGRPSQESKISVGFNYEDLIDELRAELKQ